LTEFIVFVARMRTTRWKQVHAVRPHVVVVMITYKAETLYDCATFLSSSSRSIDRYT
jgi:hypothetical protein